MNEGLSEDVEVGVVFEEGGASFLYHIAVVFNVFLQVFDEDLHHQLVAGNIDPNELVHDESLFDVGNPIDDEVEENLTPVEELLPPVRFQGLQQKRAIALFFLLLLQEVVEVNVPAEENHLNFALDGLGVVELKPQDLKQFLSELRNGEVAEGQEVDHELLLIVEESLLGDHFEDVEEQLVYDFLEENSDFDLLRLQEGVLFVVDFEELELELSSLEYVLQAGKVEVSQSLIDRVVVQQQDLRVVQEVALELHDLLLIVVGEGLLGHLFARLEQLDHFDQVLLEKGLLGSEGFFIKLFVIIDLFHQRIVEVPQKLDFRVVFLLSRKDDRRLINQALFRLHPGDFLSQVERMRGFELHSYFSFFPSA